MAIKKRVTYETSDGHTFHTRACAELYEKTLCNCYDLEDLTDTIYAYNPNLCRSAAKCTAKRIISSGWRRRDTAKLCQILEDEFGLNEVTVESIVEHGWTNSWEDK